MQNIVVAVLSAAFKVLLRLGITILLALPRLSRVEHLPHKPLQPQLPQVRCSLGPAWLT